MHAIDTNVLVRYLTGDDPEQAVRAKNLVDGGAVFVAITVLLETEWVLRSVYGFGAAALARALRGFAGLPGVKLEDASNAAQALVWMEAGMDFADALHLAKAAGCESFVTFDARLARAAKFLGIDKVAVL